MTDIRTVLFDLDGTLADTAPDLAYALNCLLLERGHASLPYEVLRPIASHGAKGLIGRGFQLTPQDAGYADLRQRFLDIYAANLVRETRLFPGITELLDALRSRGLRWRRAPRGFYRVRARPSRARTARPRPCCPRKSGAWT